MKTTGVIVCIAFASTALVMGCRHDEHPETPAAIKHDAELGAKKAGEGVKKAGEGVKKGGEKVEEKMEEKRNEP